MDLNPDQMIAAGNVRPASFVARTFDFLNRPTLRRGTLVVVLDPFMAKRINCKRNVTGKLLVIPPWPHVAGAKVAENRVAAFRSRHGRDGKCVVMYSGNHAIQHPLDTLLASADKLVDDDRIRFVFIGSGAGGCRR
jgi:colanic acid biosynthesis glycosyl transferase WcaI